MESEALSKLDLLVMTRVQQVHMVHGTKGDLGFYPVSRGRGRG
jgi:hypothetical protein